MKQHIERTLVMLKPDAIQRGIVGKVITRFEDAGLKIVGMKLVWVDKDFASKHYTEDITRRRGQKVRDLMLDMITSGPVIAFVLEGIEAIETVRKMVGATEPKAAAPGTIRGDFTHVSYAYCDAKSMGVKNIVHASSDQKDAEHEVKLWFSDSELFEYSILSDKHVLE